MIVAALLLLCSLTSCGEIEKPAPEPYYGGTAPPRKQEFRWSNGRMPRSADPARAAAPPETDLVRAVFEGLTELDPRTLKAVPAAAERWTASEDQKTWTFYLRADARWSNGAPVTASDFVRSWSRLGELGDTVAHHDLLANIVGFPFEKKDPRANPQTVLPGTAVGNPTSDDRVPVTEPRAPSVEANTNSSSRATTPAEPSLGVTAVNERTLKVALIAPDKDFPKLVAYPMFRPIAGDGSEFGGQVTADIVTNGAFRIAGVDASGLTLIRSDSYWNKTNVRLEAVRLVPSENAEGALAAYRAGDIDAVTNAEFEPLALKLLEPFEDFRRRTHAAVNFYEVNHEKAPFDDRRVREALAISIERERLTEGEMEGLTRPALSFLPFGEAPEARLAQDKERARDLLEEAGFPDGKDFPVVKLVVNRNDMQQRVARAVARMWKQNLNIETEIVVKENAELEAVRRAGDFDLVRRNAVFPTANELMSILSILKPPAPNVIEPQPSPSAGVEARPVPPNPEVEAPAVVEAPDVTMSEANAVYELWAIPLYFPTSYSLVKPYVTGFEMNSLDAPLLTEVSIDSDWQPK